MYQKTTLSHSVKCKISLIYDYSMHLLHWPTVWKLWNNLPLEIQAFPTLSCFKRDCKTICFKSILFNFYCYPTSMIPWWQLCYALWHDYWYIQLSSSTIEILDNTKAKITGCNLNVRLGWKIESSDNRVSYIQAFGKNICIRLVNSWKIK